MFRLREGRMIKIDDFAKLELRVGKVLSCEAHPNADKLLVLKIDIGEDEPRQAVAGLRPWYEPESLVGRQVVFLANLEPAVLRGVESRGMLLAATDGSKVSVIAPDAEMAPGSVVR